MNILSGIKITGEIYCEYAFLQFEYAFKSCGGEAVSAEYRFSLPEGAAISAVKIIADDGRITDMSPIPLSHAAALYDFAEAAILRKLDDKMYTLCLASVTSGGCRVLLSVYAPVSDITEIPLCGGGVASAEIYVHGAEGVSSLTHDIQKEKLGGSIKIKADKITADGVLCIKSEYAEKINSAIAAVGVSGGELLCRLYTGFGRDFAYVGENGTVIREYDDGCAVYVKYRGDIPESITLRCGSEELEMPIEQTRVYRSFAMPAAVCAGALCSKYYEMLRVCSPDEKRKIRSKIEEVGIKYSVLNSETALAAVTGSGKPKAVRVIIPDPCEKVHTDTEADINEADFAFSAKERSERMSLCKQVIVSNIRACGGIFASGEINPKQQKYQTLLCTLALRAAGESGAYIDDAEYFAADFSDRGLKPVRDAGLADKMLEIIFGEGQAICSGTPDLYTAANMIWQMNRANNDIFC